MNKNKKAYFQGTEKPTPKKKQYKSDPVEHVKTRFSQPFFKNFDLYSTPGKHSPGGGWNELMKYKSVSDFLKNKRKKIKNKYKNKKSQIRKKIFLNLIKNALDFSIDEQIKSGPILGENISGNVVPIGGYFEYLPLNDFENKSPDKLNFGRDYEDSDSLINLINDIETPIQSGPVSLYGLPDGIKDIEDLESLFYDDPKYGITDSGNTIYDNMWFV